METVKKGFGFMDFLSTVMIGMALLIGVWVADASRDPSSSVIKSYWIETGGENRKIKIDDTAYTGQMININQGDIIHVVYEVNRKRRGEVTNERYFYDGNSSDPRETQLSSMIRKIDATRLKNQRAETEFRVPLNAKLGCNAFVYSKNNYVFALNPITQMKNPVHTTQKIQLCIFPNTPIKS